HRRVKAHAALERTDRAAVLNAEAAVDADLAGVVHPGDAELDDPLGLYETVEEAVLRIARVLADERPDRFHDLAYGLEELGLLEIALFDVGEEGFVRGVTHGGLRGSLHFARNRASFKRILGVPLVRPAVFGWRHARPALEGTVESARLGEADL